MVQDADIARGYIGAATDTSSVAAHSAGGGRGTLVYQGDTTPVDGTNGTYAGLAPAGALLVAPNGDDAWTLYQNTGTQASPVWTERSAASGGGVTVPLSVTNGDSLEVLAIGEDGGTTHRMASGESFTVNVAAEDVDHAYNVIDVDESFLKINLSQYFFTQFALQSRGSSDRRLILAGYNSDDEIVVGFATGKVGFFDTPGVTRPEVPASPTVQDVVDALKALGLITQAT